MPPLPMIWATYWSAALLLLVFLAFGVWCYRARRNGSGFGEKKPPRSGSYTKRRARRRRAAKS